MDLAAYFKRIEWNGPVKTDLETLRQIHFHHATRIPFENIDIQLGIPIALNLPALEEKMVRRRRGGYCFEQNHLFQAALREIGFDVTACEARVRMAINFVAPRTHMLLVVKLSQGAFLCDVGFGGEGLFYPVPMNGESNQQFLWSYRVREEGRLRVLQSQHQGAWTDLYAFDPAGCEPIDFEVANWFTSTYPQSRFVLTLTAQLPLPEARYILRNRTYVIDRGEQQDTRELQNKVELLQILDRVFGLSFPPDAPFRNPAFPE
jgi:N-hydroxyarylamine O-acetyltransferase